jgi:putative endonuclease
MAYTVYILFSPDRNKYYVGHTNNLQRKLTEHRQKKSQFGKNSNKFELVFTEKYISKSKAYQREMQIKSYKNGQAFKKLVNK